MKFYGIKVIEFLLLVVDIFLVYGVDIVEDDNLKLMFFEKLVVIFWKDFINGKEEIILGIFK